MEKKGENALMKRANIKITQKKEIMWYWFDVQRSLDSLFLRSITPGNFLSFIKCLRLLSFIPSFHYFFWFVLWHKKWRAGRWQQGDHSILHDEFIGLIVIIRTRYSVILIYWFSWWIILSSFSIFFYYATIEK